MDRGRVGLRPAGRAAVGQRAELPVDILLGLGLEFVVEFVVEFGVGVGFGVVGAVECGRAGPGGGGGGG